MRIKKVAAWVGKIFAKLRLLFMFYFMFDRMMQEENKKWQKKQKEKREG